MLISPVYRLHQEAPEPGQAHHLRTDRPDPPGVHSHPSGNRSALGPEEPLFPALPWLADALTSPLVWPLRPQQIRKKMVDIVTKETVSCDIKELVQKLIPDSIGKEIEKATGGIFPMQNVCVRKVKILKAPKLDITKLMEARRRSAPRALTLSLVARSLIPPCLLSRACDTLAVRAASCSSTLRACAFFLHAGALSGCRCTATTRLRTPATSSTGLTMRSRRRLSAPKAPAAAVGGVGRSLAEASPPL